MNTLLKKMTAISLLSLLAISSSYAMAKPQKDVDNLAQRLELDEAQTIKFKEIMSAQKTERAAMQADKKQVAKLLEDGDIDGAADKAAELARAGVYKIAEFKAQLSTVLTAQQLQQLQDIKNHKMDRMQRSRHGKHKQEKPTEQ
ncbi:hypothetical protein AADZ86_11005 [Colwelliaceae bacterium BS250]